MRKANDAELVSVLRDIRIWFAMLCASEQGCLLVKVVA